MRFDNAVIAIAATIGLAVFITKIDPNVQPLVTALLLFSVSNFAVDATSFQWYNSGNNKKMVMLVPITTMVSNAAMIEFIIMYIRVYTDKLITIITTVIMLL